jgi:Zn-dependent protease
MQVETIFFLIILILSVIIHEIAHGYVAEMLGDPTARLAGRLTLNPVRHIDPLGSVVLPALMLIASGGKFAFGWAKPVPYNPYNLRSFKWGTILVGVAGAFANLLIALIFGLMIRFHAELGIAAGTPFFEVLGTITFLNIILAVFNLIPFPPLDGAKVLFAFLPTVFSTFTTIWSKIGFFIVFVFFSPIHH